MNSEGSRSFICKLQERARKVYLADQDIAVGEDEYLDLLIRRLLQEWLTKFDIPTKYQISTFHDFNKGFLRKGNKEENMWRNDWYPLYHIQNEHYLDLNREADLSRLLPTSKVYVPSRPAFYKRLFCWIGRLMIASGSHLIKRFEPINNDLTASSPTI